LIAASRSRDHLRRANAACRIPAGGFTLLELLVVIVILGIAAGVVSLSVAPVEERRMAEDIDRLVALLKLAHDEALVTGRDITWEADATGYRFVMGTEVRNESADDPLRPRSWAFEVRRLEAPKLTFGREPLVAPARIRIVGAAREVTVSLDAFGTVTVTP
jgi:general secretion pathway protein H